MTESKWNINIILSLPVMPFRVGYKCGGHVHMCMSTCLFSIYSLNSGSLVYIACYTVPRIYPNPWVHTHQCTLLLTLKPCQHWDIAIQNFHLHPIGSRDYSCGPINTALWCQVCGMISHSYPAPVGILRLSFILILFTWKWVYQIPFTKVSVPQYCPPLWTSIT